MRSGRVRRWLGVRVVGGGCLLKLVILIDVRYIFVSYRGMGVRPVARGCGARLCSFNRGAVSCVRLRRRVSDLERGCGLRRGAVRAENVGGF